MAMAIQRTASSNFPCAALLAPTAIVILAQMADIPIAATISSEPNSKGC